MRVLLVAALPVLIGAGPLSKFSSRPPLSDYDTAAKLEDVERCLIDMDGQGSPIVYSQADRPDDATLIWQVPGGLAVAQARIDLHRTPAGTHVRSWMPAKQVASCAPISR